MGLHKTLDRRDLYPLTEAAKIVSTLTHGERHTEDAHKWAYVLVADKAKPDFAAVAVYDEENTFVGWWYR